MNQNIYGEFNMGTELNAILYEEMMDSMQEGIIVINAKGIIIRMNDVAMKLLDADSSVIGFPYALFMAENDENDEFHEIVLSTIFERKRVRGQIVKLAGKKGDEDKEEEIWVSVSVSYLNSKEAGKAVVIVMEDLTGINELRDARMALNKIRLLNGELEAAKNEAIEANEAKSRFISNISHEIRTPINAVLGMNEMILRETQDDKILEYALHIQNAGKTLHFLINDILDMSKLEAKRMELTEAEYDLKGLLQELWGLIFLRAREKGLAIYFHIDQDTPSRLYGDDIRIKQIVTNLLTNAVKYTPKGEVNLRLSFQKKPETQDMIDLIIAVEDTGIGIREEDKDAVFESFKRLDAQKNKRIEGTGLGMNITMSLLELMGGKLELESTYQKGSTFTVTIPQQIKSSELIGKVSMQEKMSIERNAKDDKTTLYAPEAKILVVDDNSMNLEVAKGLLKRTGVQVTTAESGKKALEIVKHEEFQLILMDHQMPEMDGIETLRELRKDKNFDQHKTPVVMLTANAVSGLTQLYHEEGFDDILTKPIDPLKLEEMVARLIPQELICTERPGKKQEKGSNSVKQEIKELLQKYDISLEKGLSHLHEDLEAYLELSGMFVRQADEILGKLNSFLETKDTAGYKIQVHGLKGNAATLGAEKLAECALEHEKNAQEGNIEYLTDYYQKLEEMTHRTQEAFRKLSKGNVENENEDAVWSDISRWLEQIKSANTFLEEFESDKAAELLGKLIHEKSWLCWSKKLEAAQDAVTMEYDDDKAMDILKNLLGGK